MKRLMIVDDSRFVFEEMKFMLAESDYEVVGYSKSGEEALELYGEILPDIVTMDIILPGIDGLDTSKMILEKWPDAKIVVVSSLAYDETMESAELIGAKHFLFKPFEKDQLLEILDNTYNS